MNSKITDTVLQKNAHVGPTPPKRSHRSGARKKQRYTADKKAEKDSFSHKSEVRAALPQVISLRHLVEREFSDPSPILRQAKISFESKLPYVVAYNPLPKSSYFFDVASVIKEQKPLQDGTKEKAEMLDKVWEEVFPSARFFSFLDTESAPIDLGRIEDLVRNGLEGYTLLSRLLDPKSYKEKSRFLYSVLIEKGLFRGTPTDYAAKLKNGLKDEFMEEEGGELLIDAASCESPQLLSILLEMGVPANFYNFWQQESPLNQALAAKRPDNEKLLRTFGATEEKSHVERDS